MDTNQHTAISLSRATFGVALVLALSAAMPHMPAAGAPAPDLVGAAASALTIDSATLTNMPDAMIDTTYHAELAIGYAYWGAITAYVRATYVARDAAAAVVATIVNPQPPAAVEVAAADLAPSPALKQKTLAIESAIATTYWSAIAAYVETTNDALDAAAALYMQGIQSFVDSTYAMRDLSAAAYGGIAQAYVGGITSVHDAQVRTMLGMADSMSDGAMEVGAAYDALAHWYARSDANIAQRLSTS
jgi:hypothetical protein